MSIAALALTCRGLYDPEMLKLKQENDKLKKTLNTYHMEKEKHIKHITDINHFLVMRSTGFAKIQRACQVWSGSELVSYLTKVIKPLLMYIHEFFVSYTNRLLSSIRHTLTKYSNMINYSHDDTIMDIMGSVLCNDIDKLFTEKLYIICPSCGVHTSPHPITCPSCGSQIIFYDYKTNQYYLDTDKNLMNPTE